MSKRVRAIVKELFRNPRISIITNQRNVYYRYYNETQDTITICRMSKKLFEKLEYLQFIPEKVVASMPRAEWDALIKQ